MSFHHGQRHVGLEGHSPPEGLLVKGVQQVRSIQVAPSLHRLSQQADRVLVLLKMVQERRFSAPDVSLDENGERLTATLSELGACVHCDVGKGSFWVRGSENWREMAD